MSIARKMKMRSNQQQKEINKNHNAKATLTQNQKETLRNTYQKHHDNTDNTKHARSKHASKIQNKPDEEITQNTTKMKQNEKRNKK